MAGQPTKLTQELQDTIVRELLEGHYLETVAQANGVATTTLYEWLEKGRNGHPTFEPFTDAVRRAQAQAEIALTQIAKGGDDRGESNGKAKCAAWLLERTRGKKFGPKLQVQLENEMSVVLDVVLALFGAEGAGRIFEALGDLDDDGIPRVLSADTVQVEVKSDVPD